MPGHVDFVGREANWGKSWDDPEGEVGESMSVSGSTPPPSGDVVETVAGSTVSGLSGSRRGAGESESGQDGSGDFRAQAAHLARLMDPVAFGDLPKPHNVGQSFDQVRRQTVAMDHAISALVHGYRLVVDDDTTVELMADAMSSKTSVPIAMQDEKTARFYRRMARAAIQALRDTPDADPQPRHACCPHCTAGTGSCVRCGVRDAVAWELCGECDREVEAEALRDGGEA